MAFLGPLRLAVEVCQPSTVGQRCPAEVQKIETTVGEKELDRLSSLPKDVLVQIISLLDMKPAVRTSVLSSIFHHLWTEYSGPLNFDDQEFLKRLKEKNLNILVERNRFYKPKKEKLWYLKWVDNVMGRHIAPTIEQFTIKFNLRKSNSQHIDNWLDCALKKSNIKRFCLDLNALPSLQLVEKDRYCFPGKYLGNISSNSKDSSFRFLTFFSTNFVNVSGEFIELLLLRCPLLEQLCVEESQHLINLRVLGSALKLKHLEVISCENLEMLEIREALHLVFFKYYGRKIKLNLENVPFLTELHASGVESSEEKIKFIFDSLSQYLPHLTILRVAIKLFVERNDWHLPMMNNLKELYVDAYTLCMDEPIFSTQMFFRAAPNLHKFTFVLGSWDAEEDDFGRDLEEPYLITSIQKLQKLEVLEFIGFRGYTFDSELLLFCVQHAPYVKEIVIDRRKPVHLRLPSKVDEDMGNLKAANRVCELEEKVPPNVKFNLI